MIFESALTNDLAFLLPFTIELFTSFFPKPFWSAHEIVPNLILGDVNVVTYKRAIEYYPLSAVLTVLNDSEMQCINILETLKEYNITAENNNWLRFNYSDGLVENGLQKEFHTAADFIHNWVDQKQQAIIVHCWAGASRSPTIVAAYLIKYREHSKDSALQLIREKRKIAYPNAFFLQQLDAFEQNFSRQQNSCNCTCVLL
ncbi:hypothetical protein RFI_39473 [Reticulomyxa filosa]|uniref:Dual specificity protein phosphatase n=1 Tax=Reticulomyxa filosa TaxID=46433 RepID=X6L950_RETFI|nr:hypothetical protein RFI_39473 [Reticulomyxa filosa]|eukprot:ETN98048.1 hypothetical protein RFI_39473 [Reticulomyxa filosa]